MDYKYIDQLLERYWECQTTLEEENILRAFFSQEDIPASLLPYRDLFLYESTETQTDVLGEDFDQKILAKIGEEKQVKARVISLTQRLNPLFKAAAVVAILITLGNAMQMSIGTKSDYNVAGQESPNVQGTSVATRDTVKVDSLQRSCVSSEENSNVINPFR